MTYTPTQIENAKRSYTSFLKINNNIWDFQAETAGKNEANSRMEFHNAIVCEILGGNKETEKKWKLFFLKEEAKKDQKLDESKAKLIANKESSADILSEIKSQKRIGEFGKWLNTNGNPFRKEHFSKNYTQKSVSTFLNK